MRRELVERLHHHFQNCEGCEYTTGQSNSSKAIKHCMASCDTGKALFKIGEELNRIGKSERDAAQAKKDHERQQEKHGR